MNRLHQLSQLLEGELDDKAAASLRKEIAADPTLAVQWAELRMLRQDFTDLLTPPPHVHARLVANLPRRRPWWPWIAVPLALAALGVLFLRPAPVPTWTVQPTGQELTGQIHLHHPAAQIRSAGRITVFLGPPLSLVVHEGEAEVQPADGETVVLGPGTRWSAPAPSSSATSSRPAPAAVPSTCDEALDACAQEVAWLEATVEAQQLEYEGTPIAWPDDLPEALKPEAFEQNVREAIAECVPDVEIVGFHCDEPPCYVSFRNDGDFWGRLVNDCPGWHDDYSRAVSAATHEVRCADGRIEKAQVLGWSWHLVRDTHPMTEDEQKNWLRRYRTRMQQITDLWPCQEALP